MKHIRYTVLLLCVLPLTACSKTILSAGASDVPVSATSSVVASDSLPDNGMCVTLRMSGGTQQLVYLRTHPTVKRQPRQTVVSTPLTVVTYQGNDVIHLQSGKALLAGTSTAGLPASVTAGNRMNECILFFGLPRDSHISIVTESGLQWRDQDIEGDTYALVLTELPRGRYTVTVNSITFSVALK